MVLRASLGLSLLCGATANAQCGGRWLPAVIPANDVSSACGLTSWDPDGSGPLGEQLVTSGYFAAESHRVYRWDGVGWHQIGGNFNGRVESLAVCDGQLVAGGRFTRAELRPANQVALWDGDTWEPLGSGLNDFPVFVVHEFNSQPVAGGWFDFAGAIEVNRIAYWANDLWNPLGAGMNHHVYALATYQGHLVAGGKFTSAGSVGANRIALWSNDAWFSLGSGITGPTFPEVRALAVYNGDLIAAGAFGTAGGINARNIARWDGSGWAPLGSGLGQSTFTPQCRTATAYGGDLVVGGDFINPSYLARWNGSTWTPLDVNDSVVASTAFQGELIIRGYFTLAGGSPAVGFARWTDTNIPWIALHPQLASTICNQPAILTTTPATGYDPLTYLWQLQDPPAPGGWRDLADGPLTIAGQQVGTLSGASTASLSVTPTANFGSAAFRCIISNACGSATSNPATLTITDCPPPCDPDVNCDGSVNGFDIEATEQAINGDFSNFCQPSADLNNDGAENGFDIETEEQRVNGAPC